MFNLITGAAQTCKKFEQILKLEFKILAQNAQGVYISGPWQNCMLLGQRQCELCSHSAAFFSFIEGLCVSLFANQRIFIEGLFHANHLGADGQLTDFTCASRLQAP